MKQHSRWRFCLAASVLGLSACGIDDLDADLGDQGAIEQGLTASLLATADSYIAQNSPNTNYGAAATLLADGDAPNGTGRDISALMLFDLSSLPAGAVISAASLRLTITRPSSQAYELYALERAWAWNQVTWNGATSTSPWAVPGALGTLDRDSTVLTSLTPSSAGMRTFRLNSAGVRRIQSWLTAPASNHGFILGDTANREGMAFDSVSASDKSRRPALLVSYSIPDTTAPDTAIASGPAAGGVLTEITASFTFTSSESGSSFQCALDSSGFAPCLSPKDYSGLSTGSHTFSVRAMDGSGNIDASPASRTWTIQAPLGTLTFADNFDRDADTFVPPWTRMYSQTATSTTATDTNVVRKGTHSMRMTVVDADTSTFGYTGVRAHIYKAGVFPQGSEKWIGFSVYIPQDHPQVTRWLNLAQIGYNRNTHCPLCLRLGGDYRFSVADQTSTAKWRSAGTVHGAWQDLVFHIKFSSDPTVGFMEIWLNGVPQTMVNGSRRIYFSTLNSADTNLPGDFHLNNYRERGQYTTGTVYFDEAKVGDAYEDVDIE